MGARDGRALAPTITATLREVDPKSDLASDSASEQASDSASEQASDSASEQAGGQAGSDDSGARLAIDCPTVGHWRDAPARGELVTPGAIVGELEILGVAHRLLAPAGARGVVVAVGPAAARGPLPARIPVGHGDRLLVLDPEIAVGAAQEVGAASASAADGLSFRAPTSGRYYGRPAPDKPPFVTVGDDIAVGQTVCLLEVMKTFHRVTYGGDDLPSRARVTAIRPADEDDLSAGDVILVLESIR